MKFNEMIAKGAMMVLLVIAMESILRTIGFPSTSFVRDALAGAAGVALGEVFFNYSAKVIKK